MADLIVAYAQKCKCCGKEFFPTAYHVYKKKGMYYCSWSCLRRAERSKPPKKIVIPQVGDTIEIRYLAGITSYIGKVGVVQKIDSMGQLHGTWGELVVVPGEDRYKIIEVKKDD